MMNDQPTLAVVGGGAAGLVASLVAARAAATHNIHLRVILLERMHECGRKLRATGNGRGNLGPSEPTPLAYVTDSSEEDLMSLLSLCDQELVLDLFRSIGLEIVEESGRLYPVSLQAAQIRDSLELACKAAGVDIRTGSDVTELKKSGEEWMLTYRSDKDDRKHSLHTQNVILALGGSSQPALGADGAWQTWLHDCDVPFTSLRPGLQSLDVMNSYRFLKGQRQKACASLWRIDNGQIRKLIAEDRGEVQFTADGLSGVVIMQLSLYVSGETEIQGGRLLRPDNESTIARKIPETISHSVLNKIYGREAAHAIDVITLDLMPEYSYEALLNLLWQREAELPWLRGNRCLVGLLPDKLSSVVLSMLEKCMQGGKGSAQAQGRAFSLLAKLIKFMPFPLERVQESSNAQVSLGGISLSALEPKSFELKKMPSVYVIGEMIDVAALCGGYNLAFAFASGVSAASQVIQNMVYD